MREICDVVLWLGSIVVLCAAIFLGGYGIYSCEQRYQERIAMCIVLGHEPMQCKQAVRP